MQCQLCIYCHRHGSRLPDSVVFYVCFLQLPTDADICSTCIPSPLPPVADGKYSITIPIPDDLASSLIPGNLQVGSAMLLVEVTVATKAVRVELTGSLMFGSSSASITISFDTAAGRATITGMTTASASVNDFLSVFSSNLASSAGLDAVSAESVEFSLDIARGQPIIFFIRLQIASASELVTNLIGAAGLPTGDIQSVLEAANLDSFDITNIEFLVSNSGGRVCAEVSGTPVLEQLSDFPTITVEIKACDITSRNRTVEYGFSVSYSVTS